MKHTKLSQLIRWGAPALLSLSMAACVPGDGDSSSSESSQSQPQSSSSSSEPKPSSSSSSTSSVASSSSSIPANNIAVNGGVENGTTNWAARGNAQISRVTDERQSGNASLLVTDREDYWQGATFNVGQLTPGNQYEVAVWVKLASGEPMETIKLTGKIVDDDDDSTYLEYTEIASATITSSEWTLLSGAYVPDAAFDSFILESFEGSENVSFYVDGMVVAGEVDPLSSSSSSSTSSSTPGTNTGNGLSALVSFPVGVAVNLEGGGRDTLNSSQRRQIVADNFSQVSVENSMKMSYWNESNFGNSRVDSLIQQLLSPNNLTLHGHTLVWHRSYQLPSWATDDNNNFEQDFERHVKGVAAKYHDYIVSWDVVNEGLYDSADDGDNGGGQAGQGAAEVGGVQYRKSVFYRKMGADYIAKAFEWADQAAPNADLYYNDFNTENHGNSSGSNKTTSMVNLVTNLVNAGVPIDGVGFQMHVLPDWPSIDTIKQSWQRALDIAPHLKLKITELDVRVNNQYSDPPQVINSCNNCPELQNQKQRYKDIIEAYFEVVPAHRRGGITIWGISDPDSWFAQDPDWPLLWDGNLNPKPAYDGVKEALEAGN